MRTPAANPRHPPGPILLRPPFTSVPRLASGPVQQKGARSAGALPQGKQRLWITHPVCSVLLSRIKLLLYA